MKKHWYIWLSIFLSTLVPIASCGVGTEKASDLLVSTEEAQALQTSAMKQLSEKDSGLVQAQQNFVRDQYLHVLYDKHQAALREAQKRSQSIRAASVGRPAVAASQSLTAAPPGQFLPVEYDQACGGDLPPCDPTLKNESGGNIRIWNRHCYAPVGWAGSRSPCGGSTASGKWQFVRGTWNHFMGYLNAADAPASVQNEKARQLWAHGCGAFHWGLSPRAYGC